MDSIEIALILTSVIVITILPLVIGWVLYKKIRKEQEVQSQIPTPTYSGDVSEESRALAERLRREKLRKDSV